MKHLLIIAFFPLLLAQTCPEKRSFITNQTEVLSLDRKDTTALNAPNKEDSDSIEWDGEYLMSFITFRVSDESGNDLLDPASKSPKAIDISNVNMFYVTNGKEELYYQANLDVKKGFGLGPPRERIGPYYTITFALNLQPMGEITTTIIDWGNGCRDVIKAEYGIYPASIILEKAWLNDQLIMDTPHGLRSPNGVYEIKR